MATLTKTTRWPFKTRITNLATNTTLGTASEHVFVGDSGGTALTMEFDSTAGTAVTRSIKSVIARLSVRDKQTTATDFDGFRVGVQINAVAFSDTDTTVTLAHATSDHTTIEHTCDLTSYFVTNDPGTATFTVGIRARYQNGIAANVTGMTCILEVTYSYDDTATKQFKTVCVPIQSHHTTYTTSYVEIGVAGVSPAPVNQIPQWTGAGGLLTETGAAISKSWIDVWFEDQNSSGQTNTFRVDGATDLVRWVNNQDLSTTQGIRDRLITNDATNGDINLSSAAAHALEAKVDTSAGTDTGGLAWVTYSFTPTVGDTAFNSIMIPLNNGSGDTASMRTNTTAGDAESYEIIFDVQEPGPITMRQSGFMMHFCQDGTTRSMWTSGQAERTYTIASNSPRVNAIPLVHRIDHSFATSSIRRGRNRIPISQYSAISSYPAFNGGFAIINYHSGTHTVGGAAKPGRHAHTTMWPVVPTYSELATGAFASYTPTAPVIAEDYTIIGSYSYNANNQVSQSGAPISAERQFGEGAGSGWERAIVFFNDRNTCSGNRPMVSDTTKWWRSNTTGVIPNDRRRLDLEVSRDWQVFGFLGGCGNSIAHYVTYHSITHTLSGTYTIDGIPVASGTDVVDVYGNNPISGETVVYRDLDTNGSGVFTVDVYDDTLVYTAKGKGATAGASVTGYISNVTEAPKIVGRGASTSGTGALTPAVPDHAPGDVLYLPVQSKNGEAVTAPTGWTEVTDSPQNATACRLHLFRKVVALSAGYNSVTTPTVADPGDHAICPGILCVRGADTTTPEDVTEGGTAASGTAVSITGDNTTVDKTLVLAMVANDTDSGSLQVSANFVNANLVGLRQTLALNAIDGTGGGVYGCAGVLPVAGAVGATTGTLATASTQAKLMVAIKPLQKPAASSFNITAFSAGSSGFIAKPVGSQWIG